MRVSEVFSQRIYLRNLKEAKQNLDEALLRMSTGRRVRYGSDDPSAAAEVVRLADEAAKVARRREGISVTRPWLEETETAISQLGTSLSKVWNLAIEGASSTRTDDDRRILAQQVAEERKAVDGLSKTRIAGRYIFSGTLTDTPPFDDAGNYQGNDGIIRIPTDQIDIQVNIPGDEIFGTAATGPRKLLADVEAALRSGTVADVQALIEPLRQAIVDNSANLARVGNYSKALEDADLRMSDRQGMIRARASDVAAADMAEAISDSARYSQTHQATLAAGARLYGPTFFDYLG